MLRELQTILNKNTDTMNKASVAMETGMGVIKDLSAKTVGFPASATATAIYFVDKLRIPTGSDTAYVNFSDYYDKFNTIAKDEFVILHTPLAGERYATDQVTATDLTVGDYLAVGTDGIFAESATATKFIYGGEFDDAGTTLYIIQVVA
jgi:hypothetical protein